MDGLLPPPPPLSSRRKNHYSKDGSQIIDSPPEISPRDLPPPIPPRKFQNINATLPRFKGMDIEVRYDQDPSLIRSATTLKELRPGITAQEGKQNFFR
ncbi:Hypothetical predicted protein [Mytilus galloprovincialis]|uniref:Uncharacterized protein n=1 Tax=Mytilus galloprovincialis TaxID=29158 RepID=A0A8B6D9D5_MYTGA|nr:Hypothetical predicted protein [Mytilus galloprovincialis]